MQLKVALNVLRLGLTKNDPFPSIPHSLILPSRLLVSLIITAWTNKNSVRQGQLDKVDKPNMLMSQFKGLLRPILPNHFSWHFICSDSPFNTSPQDYDPLDLASAETTQILLNNNLYPLPDAIIFRV